MDCEVGSFYPFSAQLRHWARKPALQVALSYVSRDATPWSPLVIHGPSGVGKSHFVGGWSAAFRREHPHGRIVLVTGADFARTFASALELDSLTELRAKYRHADLFVLEDLHELSNKPAAQVEFLHTLDELRKRQRWVLVTLRPQVAELPGFHAGLKSRLAAGLAIPVLPPSEVTRCALVRELARRHEVRLSEEQIEEVANGTGRELPSLRTAPDPAEGNSRTGGPSVCRPSDGRNRRIRRTPLLLTCGNFFTTATHLTVRSIIRRVAAYYHLRTSELVGSSRRQGIVRARNLAIYLSRKLTNSSYQQLGQQFGRRDHTTILHAFNRTCSAIEQDPETKQAAQELTQQLLTSFSAS